MEPGIVFSVALFGLMIFHWILRSHYRKSRLFVSLLLSMTDSLSACGLYGSWKKVPSRDGETWDMPQREGIK